MRTRSFNISRQAAPALKLYEWGDGEPTFLLIHGFGEGAFIWNDFSPRVAALGRTIAVDLRGHGDSDWDEHSRYNGATHLEDLNFVLDVLDLSRIVLVGHSLGGEIAIRLTAQYPERVIGLVIVDFGPELDPTASAHIRSEFVADSRVYADYQEYVDHLERKRPLIGPEVRWAIAKSALRPGMRGGYQLKRDPAMGTEGRFKSSFFPSLWPLLKDTICPVLVVRGIASAVLPASVAQRMVEELPDGYLAPIRLAGHAVMSDNPEDFAAATLSFIREKVVPGPTRVLERSIGK
jgi:pimeloyl-ACP methyl ester carboxylesterase